MTDNHKTYRQNSSTADEIRAHLEICSSKFVPPLHATVNIKDYAEKLYQKANRLECWENHQLIGLVAFYYNEVENFNYITNVSIDPNHKGLGIAKKLLTDIVKLSKEKNVAKISLEVNIENKAAIQLYTNFGFKESITQNKTKNTVILDLNINYGK